MHRSSELSTSQLFERQMFFNSWLNDIEPMLTKKAHAELQQLCSTFGFNKNSLSIQEFGQKMANICHFAKHILLEYNRFFRGGRFEIGLDEKVYLVVSFPETQVLEMAPPTIDFVYSLIDQPERLTDYFEEEWDFDITPGTEEDKNHRLPIRKQK